MKRAGLFLVCFLLFALIVGGCGAYLYFTPRGVLRPDGPDAVMQELMDGMDRDKWRAEYVRLCPAPVTEFEDQARVTGHIFDAAVGDGRFLFRPVPGSETDEQQDYLVSAGDADLFLARLTYDGRRWNAQLQGLDAIRAVPRTLSITVPEYTVLTLNGKKVGPSYIIDDNVLYEDMSALEMRFSSWPHLVRYAIEGIYEDAELSAEREGGLTLLYADGTQWRYTVPDAAGYSFAVTAPGEAAVTVNGAVLGAGDVAGTAAYPTRLEVPGELQGALPSFSIYAAGGLYTQASEISAVMPDGTVLTGETAGDGSVSFPLPGSRALYEANHKRVEEFLKALCEYGAGHTASYYPSVYAVAGSGVQKYIQAAISSLHWTTGVTTKYTEISSSDYIPLGDAAFICRGRVDCSTTTRYQTVDLDIRYEMLWVKVNNNWLVQDLAYA